MQSQYRETSKCEHVAGGAQECASVPKPKQNLAAFDLNQTVLPLALVERHLMVPGDNNDADLECMKRRSLH
jgi:hypothetical protein